MRLPGSGVFERGELGLEAQRWTVRCATHSRTAVARDFSGRAGETLLLTEPVAIKAARLLLVASGAKRSTTAAPGAARSSTPSRTDTHARRFRALSSSRPVARARRLLLRRPWRRLPARASTASTT